MNPSRRRPWRGAALAALVIALFVTACATLAPDGSGLEKIEHVVVIYAENRSFDHLYGLFPGADGIAQATTEQKTQLDRDDTPLAHLPPVWKQGTREPDPRFPRALPNGPFRLDAPPINLPPSVQIRNLVHRYYQNEEQIAAGRSNKFAGISDAGGLVMGYYDGAQLPMWKLAREFVLADHFFMGAFGGSYLNHFWLICACTAHWPDAPTDERAQLDERARLKVRPDRLRQRSTVRRNSSTATSRLTAMSSTPRSHRINRRGTGRPRAATRASPTPPSIRSRPRR